MEKTRDTTGGYFRIPVQILVTGIPSFRLSADPAPIQTGGYDVASILQWLGVTTKPTTVRVATKRTRALLKRCRRRIKARDFSALLELLDVEPYLIHHPWVGNAVSRFEHHPRLKRRRGRRAGKHKVDPSTIVGLVNAIVAGGRSRNKAFGLIEQWKLMSLDTAKRLYRRARTDSAPRAVVIEFPDEKVWISAEQAEIEKAAAQYPTPGAPVRRRAQDGTEIVVGAIDEGKPSDEFVLVHSIRVDTFNNN
jgi:hypothetical protein